MLARWREPAPLLLCAVLSGMLVFISFPPADLWPVAFLALCPLLIAIRGARSWRGAALLGLVAGMAGYLPGFAWLASVTVPGWMGLAFYVSLYMVAAAVAFRFVQERHRGWWPLLAALTWVGLEFIRARILTGFPWLFMGYTQYKFLALIQLSAITGVYGVSFLVVLVNAAAAQLFIELGDSRRAARPFRPRRAAMLALSVLLVLACAAGGEAARRRVRVSQGPLVGIVQQNIPRLVSDLARSDEELFADSGEELILVGQLSRQLEGRGVRLLVWPETTVQAPMNLSPEVVDFLTAEPSILRRGVRQIYHKAHDILRRLGARMNCYFLVGSISWFKPSEGYVEKLHPYMELTTGNSAVMLSPEGRFMGRYDKMHLVPFGEYVPWVDWLPFLQVFTPFQRGLTPGEEAVIFELPPAGDGEEPVRFGVLICYEDVMPSLVRRFTLRGAQFLVNITDEGWYRFPGELHQHLAMAVFRAVENRTTVVRVGNTGISCFIGPGGQMYEYIGRRTDGRLVLRDVCGVASAPVRLCEQSTFYVRNGDLFAVACLALSVALPAIPLALRLRAARTQSSTSSLPPG